jgi:hypothetical protein
MTQRISKDQYRAALQKLRGPFDAMRAVVTERISALAPSTTTTPASLPASPPGSLETSSAPSPRPGRRVPTKVRGLYDLVRRLRADSGRELFPGLTAGQIADDLAEELEELEALEEIRRYVAGNADLLEAGLTATEDRLMRAALEIYHEVRRLSRLPGSKYGPLARKLTHALRAAQQNPRGRRARRSR